MAKKVEAMVQLGMANSRMKDFYDVMAPARLFPFDGEVLTRALRATFERRRTPLPAGLPVALSTTFAHDATKQTQWVGFVRKSAVRDAGTLEGAVGVVAAFVERPLRAAVSAQPSALLHWPAGGPWR